MWTVDPVWAFKTIELNILLLPKENHDYSEVKPRRIYSSYIYIFSVLKKILLVFSVTSIWFQECGIINLKYILNRPSF